MDLHAVYRLGELSGRDGLASDVGLCLKLEKGLENVGALYLGASSGASVSIDTATMSPLGFLSRAGIWWALLRSLAKARERPGLEPPCADLIALSTIIDRGTHDGFKPRAGALGLTAIALPAAPRFGGADVPGQIEPAFHADQ